MNYHQQKMQKTKGNDKKKTAKIFSVFPYPFVVPFLDISETHVWNSDRSPHAQIHEVWQLITNSSIGVLCLWLVWCRKESRLSTILSLLVTGGLLLAFLLKDGHGGSMKYLDGSEKTLLGINIGILGLGLAFSLLLISLLIERIRPKNDNAKNYKNQ